MQDKTPPDMFTSALWYAKRGFAVFPVHEPLFDDDGKCIGCTCEEYRRSDKCQQEHPHMHLEPDAHCEHPGKCPRVRWRDKSTTDPEQITRWWRWWPGAGIGIDDGKSGILILDADLYKDTYAGNGFVIDEETPTSLTGGGGTHLWYRQPDGKQYGNAPGDLPDGLDIRGMGGYHIAPPSLHKSGRRYVFESGYAPNEIEMKIVPAALQALLDAAPQNKRSDIGPADSEAVERSAEIVRALIKHADFVATEQDWRVGENIGRRWLLADCPYSDDHADGAFVVVYPDGVIGAGCHHARCQKRIKEEGGSGWKFLRKITGFAPETPKLIFRKRIPPEEVVADIPAQITETQAEPKAGPARMIQIHLARMGYSFRYNQIRESVEMEDGTPLHDGEQATIVAQLFELGARNKSLMLDVMMADAWANRYDPLVDFLNGLEWDGQDHISRLSYHFEDRHPLIQYEDGNKRTVFSAWLYRWLVGAVARGLGDPVQNPMLVLAAEQGLGKSEFARWLCSPVPDFFVENAIDPENADHQRWATENFVWEVDELGATTRKADVEALKAFITRTKQTYRVPYARNRVSKRARVSFLGTVNPDNAGFLTDATGNRRFLTVEIMAIDWRGYTRKIDARQVWAQARTIYCQDKDAWQLEEVESVTRHRINSDFSMEDPVRDAILALFEVTSNIESGEGSFTSNADLVFQVGSQVRNSSTRGLQMDIARALKGLGVTKGRTGDDTRGYWGVRRRPSTTY